MKIQMINYIEVSIIDKQLRMEHKSISQWYFQCLDAIHPMCHTKVVSCVYMISDSRVGCPPHYHGPQCEFWCGGCADGKCDNSTGVCLQGCKPHFQGENCNGEL